MLTITCPNGIIPFRGTRRRSLGRARVGSRGALERAVHRLRARETESASAGLGPGPGGPGEGAREGAAGGNVLEGVRRCSEPDRAMVVSSADLRLMIFLPAILIAACASSSPAFLMMYSAYKLNKQGDNIQPWWRGLTECGPLEKGMANHFSILALRTP